MNGWTSEMKNMDPTNVNHVHIICKLALKSSTTKVSSQGANDFESLDTPTILVP